MITINFIGCGLLGKTIAKLIFLNKIATIQCILNTSLESSKAAATFIGQGTAVNHLSELKEADVTFITTQDDHIESICGQLASLNVLKPHSLLLHCSGALSSDVLSSAACFIASVHPVRSFANPESVIETFKNTFCSFEGDNEALPLIKTVFQGIGGVVIQINKKNKKLYHAASVMANNYVISLHYEAVTHFIASGVEENIAHQLASALMNDSFNHLKSLPHEKALTGPLQRGDANVIKDHIESFKNNVVSKNIYTSLALGTLALTTHLPPLKNKLKKILKT